MAATRRDYRTSAPTILQPGQAVTQTARLFAGAKEVDLLDRYEDKEGVFFFDKAIDWGWFEIVEKPIFYYLDWLFRHGRQFRRRDHPADLHDPRADLPDRAAPVRLDGRRCARSSPR